MRKLTIEDIHDLRPEGYNGTTVDRYGVYWWREKPIFESNEWYLSKEDGSFCSRDNSPLCLKVFDGVVMKEILLEIPEYKRSLIWKEPKKCIDIKFVIVDLDNTPKIFKADDIKKSPNVKNTTDWSFDYDDEKDWSLDRYDEIKKIITLSNGLSIIGVRKKTWKGKEYMICLGYWNDGVVK